MGELEFDAEKHEYKVDGIKLESVTEFLSKYFSPFDEDAIADKLASKPQNIEEGKDAAYFKTEWKEARDHGTRVHLALENYTQGTGWVRISVKDGRKYHQGIRYIDTRDCDKAVPEVKVYSKPLRLAGTIDRLEYNSDGSVSLVDWKTNKAISQKGFMGKKAKRPLQSMDDCSYSKYLLQLGVYAHILETEYQLRVKELVLVHLTEEGYTEYKIPRKKKLITKLLEERKNDKEINERTAKRRRSRRTDGGNKKDWDKTNKSS